MFRSTFLGGGGCYGPDLNSLILDLVLGKKIEPGTNHALSIHSVTPSPPHLFQGYVANP